MTRQTAFIEMLRDVKRSVDALIEEIETGGLPYGEYSGEGSEEPPSEPPAEEPPAEPDPEPDPAPDPTPPPAVPNDPSTSWRDAVEALRNKTYPTQDGGSVLVRSGNRTIDGLRYVSTGSDPMFIVNAAFGGTIDVLRNFELVGPMGVAGNGAKTVITQKPRTQSDQNNAGHILLIEDGRITGWPDDVLNLRGVPGAVQTMRRVYVGPQYPRPNSGAHCDMLVFPSLLGDVLIEDTLWDHIEAGLPGGGDNNFLRCVPISGEDPEGDHFIRFRRCVVHGDDYRSKLMQVVHKQNYKPRVDFEDVFLPASRIDPSDLFYPGSPINRWVNVRDTYTGELIPPPPGALTV